MANMITLRSSDGEDFEVNDAVAMQTERIRKLMARASGEPIILEDVSSDTLTKVIQYFERQRQVIAESSSPDSVLQITYRDRSDSDFVRIDWVTLFGIIMLATTLGAVSILSITGEDNRSEGTTSENHITAENVAERPNDTIIPRNQEAVGPKSRGRLMRWSAFIEGIISGMLIWVAVSISLYRMTNSFSRGFAQNQNFSPSDDATGKIQRVITDFQTWHIIVVTFLAVLIVFFNW